MEGGREGETGLDVSNHGNGPVNAAALMQETAGTVMLGAIAGQCNGALTLALPIIGQGVVEIYLGQVILRCSVTCR